MLRKIPLALVGLTVGGVLVTVGFVAYGAGYATLNIASWFYGGIILLGGLALKAAEIKPVTYSVETSDDIKALRKQQATPTQDQIRKDVTRYRYGQEAHLDDSLERLGLSPTDEERPVLETIEETAIDGNYTLVLNFDSQFISLEKWQEKQEKIAKFFGPDIDAKITQPEKKKIRVALIKQNEQ